MTTGTLKKHDRKEAGRRLRAKRIEAGKDQAELGKAIGVSPSTIGMYERGERSPRDEIKKALADYFGVDVQSLFY